jgi:uncharacterized protein (DUF885 family)
MNPVRDLSDRYHEGYLAAHPFAASALGLPGYDHLLPDSSPEGEARRRLQVEAVRAEAERIDTAGLTTEGSLSLACVGAAADQELASLDAAPDEYTVTAMPFSGPARLFAETAITVLADARGADDYLERLAGAGRWIDQLTGRLGAGASAGRLPVAPLVEQAMAWAAELLAQDVPEAIAAPQPPEGWDGASAWCDERDRLAAAVVKPALARWVAELERLLPRSRPEEAAGLAHLPGGDEEYARAIKVHTTLPLTAEHLHRTGREEVQRLEERALELGRDVGLGDLDAVRRALRTSAAPDPQAAIATAIDAVGRAEAAIAKTIPLPHPGPCAISPMPPVVADSGMAPHYTRPRLDGLRPGTYWFNTRRPTAGTGWDLESVAFHEAVPGHHLHLGRALLLDHLPALQRQQGVTVCTEGWALYAEQLAEEMGLYSSVEAILGSITASLMRAARLVVDTGLHGLGWSREQARTYFIEHVPMPEAFLANEIDRYIVWPGQALAYLTGKLEILRLRRQAQDALGAAFCLRDFHGAVIDHGSVPMPVLERAVAAWLSTAI